MREERSGDSILQIVRCSYVSSYHLAQACETQDQKTCNAFKEIMTLSLICLPDTKSYSTLQYDGLNFSRIMNERKKGRKEERKKGGKTENTEHPMVEFSSTSTTLSFSKKREGDMP